MAFLSQSILPQVAVCVVIPWFLLRGHLPRHVTHPVDEVAHHAKEAVKVAGVGKAALALLQVDLQVAPRVDDLHLMLLDVACLLTTVCHYQLRRLLLDTLHLQHQHATTLIGLTTIDKGPFFKSNPKFLDQLPNPMHRNYYRTHPKPSPTLSSLKTIFNNTYCKSQFINPFQS